jgi:hypothetical protein
MPEHYYLRIIQSEGRRQGCRNDNQQQFIGNGREGIFEANVCRGQCGRADKQYVSDDGNKNGGRPDRQNGILEAALAI